MIKKKKNRNSIDGDFSYIEHNIINSEAWKGLKAHTKWLYFEYKLRWRGDNTSHIILTYIEANKIMSIATFINDRKLLIERGFIDVIKRGAWKSNVWYMVYLTGGKNMELRILSK